MKDYVSEVYDEKRTPRTDYPTKLATYLFKRFEMRKGEKFLEIGCGRGEFLTAFSALGLDCTAVDMSDFSVESLKKFNVKKADVSSSPLPYPDNSFDIIYHKSLIEHLYSPDNLMKETYRVLKPGGKVIILTPDWVSVMKVFYEDFTHSRPYDRISLRDAMSVYGFSDVDTELFYQLPAIWKHRSLRQVCRFLQLFISTPSARALSKTTGVKSIRWAVELMVLGYGVKKTGK